MGGHSRSPDQVEGYSVLPHCQGVVREIPACVVLCVGHVEAGIEPERRECAHYPGVCALICNYVLSNIVQEANLAQAEVALFPGRHDWDAARAEAGMVTTTSEDMHGGELFVEDREVVREYELAFRRLSAFAASPADTLKLIASLA